MTNEEAVTELTRMYKSVECHDCITSMAFTKAKEALESIDRITAERDKAVEDLISYKDCEKCKYNDLTLGDYPCSYCDDNYSNWVWIGIK